LRFEDFLTTLDDEATAVQSITPLQVAELECRQIVCELRASGPPDM